MELIVGEAQGDVLGRSKTNWPWRRVGPVLSADPGRPLGFTDASVQSRRWDQRSKPGELGAPGAGVEAAKALYYEP